VHRVPAELGLSNIRNIDGIGGSFNSDQMKLAFCSFLFLLLLASMAAVPVQLMPRNNNISTDDNAFSPEAGQAWGPDVSHYQGNINWALVKKVSAYVVARFGRVIDFAFLFLQAGASFAFAKATEGLDFVDSSFIANRHGMRNENFSPRGYYHFGHPGESASVQAAHFCKTVGALGAEEVAVLDIEVSDSVHPAQVAQWSKDFVDEVMHTLGLPASRVLVCKFSPSVHNFST
jgi:GH25 family lysozyme M1 (1,4-beta-N-acetylmuramidase)